MIRTCLIVLGLCGQALGAPVRVVVLPSAPARELPLARLVEAARAAVAEREALETVDLAGVLDPEGGATDAEAQLQEARTAYDNLEAEAALQLLAQAAPALVAAGSTQQAARAFELTARIRLGLRDRGGAVAACRAWLALEDPPDLRQGGAPPSLVEALEAARKGAGAEGALRVDAPIPARVHLNGRPRGITPVFVPALRGPQVVTVEADGFQRAVYLVEPRAELGVAVMARLRPASRGRLLDEVYERLPGQMDQDPVGPGLKDLRALAAADQVVLVEWPPEGARAALFDLEAGRRVRLVQLPDTEDPEAAGHELVAALYSGLDPRAPGLAAPEVEVPEVRPYHRRWWFWPAVAAAAIAAVAVPVAVLSEDDPPGVTRKPGTGSVIIRF